MSLFVGELEDIGPQVHSGPVLFHLDRSAENNFGFQGVGSEPSESEDDEVVRACRPTLAHRVGTFFGSLSPRALGPHRRTSCVWCVDGWWRAVWVGRAAGTLWH